jgi:hypothetical protein
MYLRQHLGRQVERRALKADGEPGSAQSFGQRPGDDAGSVCRVAVSMPQ